jgi:DNA-binding NarL/FixJ family response regulator
MPRGKIRLLIVDEDPAYREGLRATFESGPDIDVVGEADTGEQALEMAASLKPDVVLIDVSIQGMGGTEVTRRLAATHPAIRVLILTLSRDREHLREARRAGASAYVMKDALPSLLLDTIRGIVEGEHPLLQRADQTTDVLMPDRLPPSEPPEKPLTVGTDYLLTSNERAILKGLAAGLTNDQIGHRLGVPESMVRTYLAEIYRKLGLPGRDAAAQYARDNGITD